jgi:hypothetical protein
MKIQFSEIKKTFKDSEIITSADLFNFYKFSESTVKKATVNWRIFELVHQINSVIKKEFPFIKYCIWNSSILSEFLQHQSSFRFIVVEVEKDALESVFYSIKEIFNATFKKPAKEVVEEFISARQNSIIINSFVSEAPIQNIKNVPTSSIEKLLVDLYCEKNLFYFLQGNELVNIYKNAFDKYTVNQSKMLRYADRRRKKIQIDEFIKSIIRQ